MKYNTLFMDADDTLLDYQRSEKEALRKTFLDHGLSFDEEVHAYYRSINHRVWAEYEKSGSKQGMESSPRFVEMFREKGISLDGMAFNLEYMQNLANCSYMIPGAKELLEELREHYKIYIVTNGSVTTQPPRFRDSGIEDLTDGAFISQKIGLQKPSEEYFSYVFRETGAKKESTLLIGDSLSSDISGGQKIGMDTCWYNPKELPMPEVAPTYTVKNFDEIKKILL